MDKTLEYYEKYAGEFYENTIQADVADLYKMFLEKLPDGAAILDLGCGSGRDSKFYLQQGYKVTAMDGSPRMCELASSYIGQPVFCKNFEEIDYNAEFDGIWTCASLLHVAESKMEKVLNLLQKALKPQGTLYASFKYGNKERIRNGRYFNDYTEGKAATVFTPSNGWGKCECWITGDVRSGREEELWLNIIAIKNR